MPHQVKTTKVADRHTLIVAGGRDALTYGQYLPVIGYDAAGGTCGLRDATALSNFYNSSSVNTVTFPNADYPSGSTISGKTVYGDITLATGIITFDNCDLPGGTHVPTTNQSIVRGDNNRSGSTSIATFKDCRISPRTRALNRDCVRGNRLRIYRCEIKGGIDGLSGFALSSQNSGNANNEFCGNHITDLAYGYPDYDNGTSGATEHSDGTHNDCIALQGGTNQLVWGNYIGGYSTELAGNTHPLLTQPQWVVADGGWNNGGCIIVNEDAGTQTDNTTIIKENWLSGGLSQVNIKVNTTFMLQDNQHYRDVAQNGSPLFQGFWIRLDDHTPTITSLESEHVWVDGPFAGSYLTGTGDSSTWNTNGIHYNDTP